MLLLAISGCCFVFIGVRGRKIGSMPTCAKCTFDLSGARSDSDKCPECGNDLKKRNATRVGVRKRSPLRVLCGAFLLLIGLLMVGAAVVPNANAKSLAPKLPLGALVFQAKVSSTKAQTVWIDEIRTRIPTMGPGDKAQVANLVQFVLQLQQDSTRAWNTSWGDLVVDAHDFGVIPNATMEQFIVQSVSVQLLPKEPVVIGRPIRFDATIIVSRTMTPVNPSRLALAFPGYHRDNRYGVLANISGAATTDAWGLLTPVDAVGSFEREVRVGLRRDWTDVGALTVPLKGTAVATGVTPWLKLENSSELDRSPETPK